MRATGAYTIAQDEQSCVILGMPCSAIEIQGASKIVPLRNIAAKLISVLSEGRSEGG